jgi:hypothetical protein
MREDCCETSCVGTEHVTEGGVFALFLQHFRLYSSLDSLINQLTSIHDKTHHLFMPYMYLEP